jgi:hypothetical protein
MPQLAIRLTDADHATLLAAARRVQETDDPNVGGYVREAALAAAQVETWERRLSDVLALHREILRRSRPRLTAAEWRLVLDACNGLWLMADRGHDGPPQWDIGPSAIPYEVADAIRLNDLGSKHGVEDAPELVRRLAACSYAELAAIADVVVDWWSREPRELAGPVPGEEGWEER